MPCSPSACVSTAVSVCVEAHALARRGALGQRHRERLVEHPQVLGGGRGVERQERLTHVAAVDARRARGRASPSGCSRRSPCPAPRAASRSNSRWASAWSPRSAASSTATCCRGSTLAVPASQLRTPHEK